jgi:hypothetical protein
MVPLIVSFFTPAYEAEAREMEATAREFGLDTDVRAVPSRGDWTLNCGMKPAFIRSMQLEYPDRPIVWLDADARVRRMPDLFTALDCDFAAHWRYASELLSGTLYLGPTPAAKALVSAWCEAQAKAPGEWDQKTLQRVIESGFPARIERLPAEYTAIFDAGMCDEPVVEHMQASRRLAKIQRNHGAVSLHSGG